MFRLGCCLGALQCVTMAPGSFGTCTTFGAVCCCQRQSLPSLTPSLLCCDEQVTPAHDPNDFLVGKRHSLEFINIFDDNGLINNRGGQFAGQPRFQVRSASGEACDGRVFSEMLLTNTMVLIKFKNGMAFYKTL